ncbi:MAG: PAS domain S-box protein [Deltaproteobacteria bacterium]|nr:PAS domain S-box protein [Deltaproteobacteria bacterium]
MNKRRFVYIIPVVLALIVAVAGWFATDCLGNKARREIIRESQASVFTLSVYVSTTINVVENAVKALADSPWIAPALLSKGKRDIEQANSVLDRYSSNFSSISFLMDADGMTVASSNRRDPDSFVGQSYAFRPYFREAAEGRLCRYFAVGVSSGKRGVFASYPVQNQSGEVIGVVTMKRNIDEIETFFSKYPFCFLISRDGIIFLSSKPAMVTKSLWTLDTAVQEELIASRQFSDKISEAVIKKEIVDGSEVVLENNDYFVSRKVIDSDGWSIVLLTPTDRIRHYRLIGILATISACILIMVFSGIIYVTDRSREVLRQSEENKRLLLHAVGDGIFGVDTAGKVTFINASALRMLGFAEAEMLRQGVHGLIHHSHEDGTGYPIEDCPMFASYTHAADSHVGNEVLWRKDGSSFPVEYSSMPINKDGKIMGAVVSFTDITERKQAEKALLENRKQLADVIDFLPDATLAIDKQGRVIIWNKKIEEMTGVPAAEMIGKGDHAYTIPFYGEVRPQLMDLIFMNNGNTMARYPNITREGDSLSAEVFCNALYNNKGAWVFAKASPLHDQSGNIIGAIERIRDITDRKRAEEEKDVLQAQLLQAQKMESVGRLAGGVAHDFNNMLTAIIGHAGLAMKRCSPSEPIHGHLKAIEDSAHRSADLTRQLLAFARKQIVAPKVLDMNDTVSSMLKMLLRLIGEDIDLVWRPGADLWQVRIDPSQIDQLLANLCVNARDSITGVGKVTIETENIAFDEAYCAVHLGFVCGEYVMLAVSDNGCGMGKETLPHIFEPFFTTKEEGKGTGLGLATVYGIVKQNNGFVNVYSEPDKGTTFKIYLPRLVGEAVAPAAESTAPTPTGHGETVLLVEDEPVILDVSREMLEQLGYAVIVAGTPGEALRMAKAHADKIQMLITDVVMPEMNGRDLANLIRDIKPGMKCLFISGYTANVIAHHGMLDPGINFIQKPFSMEHLAVKVRGVLDDAL